ncbi:hypothetical protein PVAP13_9KG014140 [Panicum virgatum]|uniref:Uncharacterized protein n=1 Tax=Panicum virgatum TaxID=38727 RepID=A0A8T0N6X0_PANVG|nr:hypothetical protein PVAP13_9KG014140 [Panicum virgatum]
MGVTFFCLCILKFPYKLSRQPIRWIALSRLYDVHGTLNVTPDVEHLLWLMEHHFGTRGLFPDHASLAPLKSCGTLFKDLHHLFKVKIFWAQYYAICLVIATDITGTDWRTGVKDNNLLRETYYYKVSGSEYEVLHNTPTQRRLTSAQIDALQLSI